MKKVIIIIAAVAASVSAIIIKKKRSKQYAHGFIKAEAPSNGFVGRYIGGI